MFGLVWFGHDIFVILGHTLQVEIIYCCQNVQESENKKSQNLPFQVEFWNHYAIEINFFGLRHFKIHQGSQLSHDQTIPNQIKPFKALFEVFLTYFWTKNPNSGWI